VHPILQDNRVLNSRYAVHDMNATDLEIQGNTFSGNLSGLVLMYGGPVNVRQNTIVESGSPSTGFGVLVKDVGTTLVEENVIADNRVGLHLDNAGRTTGTGLLLTGNTIAMNQIGMMLYPSTVATFTRNSFVENSTQVTLGGQGTTQSVWDPGGVGNYWSDYGGYDANHDGVGDLPYTQSGRMSRLMEENPYLLALSSGPAFRLLSAVEDKWSPARALVTDNHPSMNSGAAQLSAGRSGNSVALWLPGAVLTLACGIFLARARRPRRGKRNGVPAYA
jgi:nitrous oxidase accessory protein